MTNSVGWQVHSMKSLSLFGQVTLDPAQVKALSTYIPHIIEKIYKGCSDVLNDPSMAAVEPAAVARIPFAAKTTPQGDLRVSYDGGRNYVNAGSLKAFPTLLHAMLEAYDAARIYFPSAFREAKPIGELRHFANDPESLLGEVRGVGLDINSGFRNGFSAAGSGVAFVPWSGVAAGGLSIWAGSELALKERDKYYRAVFLGDEEGKKKARADTAVGVFYALTGLGQLGAFAPSAYDLLPGPSSSTTGVNVGKDFGYVADTGTILMSLAMVASVYYENQYITEFRNAFDTVLNLDVSPQRKAIAGLEFLQQQICLTAKDWGELAEKGLDRDIDAINKKYLEKYDRFVRRVGALYLYPSYH